MSVQQEPMRMNQSTASEKKENTETHEEPPKLEFARSSESLEAFGAALGGAVLGVLATLLILAIINNGTLRFTGAVASHYAPASPVSTKTWQGSQPQHGRHSAAALNPSKAKAAPSIRCRPVFLHWTPA
ncbi:MAG: hypothetical protein R2873_02935 [Caldilineaceae bacterium]